MTKVVPKVNQGGLVLAKDAAALLHRLQRGRDVFCVFVKVKSTSYDLVEKVSDIYLRHD